MTKSIPLSSPGKILLQEFLEPLGISQYRLAKDIGVSARRINEIVHGKRAITPDTSLRLARYLRMSDRFFLNLQSDYDLRLSKRQLEKTLTKHIRPFPRPDLETQPAS
jgi:antitoxin HigA-1